MCNTLPASISRVVSATRLTVLFPAFPGNGAVLFTVKSRVQGPVATKEAETAH